MHCPQAVRILDFAHHPSGVPANYLAAAAQASFGPATAATSEWVATWRHSWRQGEAERVLTAVAARPESPERAAARRYRGERRPMIASPAFVAASSPIGSGCVESAHTTVLQTRLKQGGYPEG